MRKFLKQNILEMFRTLYEAHGDIKRLIDKKDYENACTLLGECQEVAVQIGTAIDESEGEGSVAVSFLEEYCEVLYEVAAGIADTNTGVRARKSLDKKLINAENSVRNDIKVKLEIVFCPYKASMWDSLESVWKAADDDPDCDAYVVPIPYYDRNPDRSFGEFHYEGGDFPHYVPVTHYEAYNFEKRRPDVIYIHNPYDAGNYVTSVDPRFYSGELKKWTECLVYIPYFVLAEPNPEDENCVDAVSHFVLTSGVFNADKVVVQSEAMKQVYVKVLLKRFGDTADNRKIFNNKILGTGSPKFDKVAASSNDNIDIPDEWLKIIRKPDGTCKKVVFYNTSVVALLKHNEKVFEKMNSVFKVFYEYKDDIALLWRPHPLIKATIESMRPTLLKAYSEIVERYISEGWGIYDDTPDLDRAIALSDVYMGDTSSVVQLYEIAGKTVYVLGYTAFEYGENTKENFYLNFTSAVNVDNTLYFAEYDFNSLFSYDISTNRIKYEACFEAEKFLQFDLYKDCISYNDKIYFFPCWAKQIAEYDIYTKEINYFGVSEWDATLKTGVWHTYRK
ncbi:MAG: hypothetical protein ACI4KR_13225, partial [Ruminiclostridium sp.]